MATLESCFYHFDERRIANWTAAQEKSISQDYPFAIRDETPEDYVARTYLQFLWLPESLMPLQLLVPSLRRVNAPSTSKSDASVHPMHALLEPLLLTTRSLAEKYHVVFPQILADGGGAGEMEETMMWYALTHEKTPEGKEDVWSDNVWRERYLEWMERREVQIQILLYFYKLALPGPPPHSEKPKKRSRKPVEPEPTAEDHLEAFMDRLSMWQLVGNLEQTSPSADDRDWTQMFVEGLVERHFKPQLPDLCALLRSKVFPSSPFSDTEGDGALSDTAEPQASTSRLPSPVASMPPRTANILRSRSRSISVSLAQEQKERDRASTAPPKKRILNREVSMSRVFKPKPKRPVEVDVVKSKAPAPSKPPPRDNDIILVDETPQKPRTASVRTMSFGQPGTIKFPALNVIEDDDDEEWVMHSSPDIVLLNPDVGTDSDGEKDLIE
ncbi:hypothetical protein HYPSUDRAFT_209728 [Hypholoma sublateritium FD-334 SS-4]|uniref:DNA replication regulator Sld3 C-terminal domain-containing protein n=1 Tax=Hypholoma sublateritium (strain FD-334 SS-4) TaxID=945553 RepID=A0A0D2KFQ0_HYPSF|nr:hypothetical protein HYPSUDRAFT_209728 [Hypholoma sublateritium FD-334 SS-4]